MVKLTVDPFPSPAASTVITSSGGGSDARTEIGNRHTPPVADVTVKITVSLKHNLAT